MYAEELFVCVLEWPLPLVNSSEMLVDSESTEQPVSNYNTFKQTDIEMTGMYIVDVKLRNKHANIPISYLNNQVGVVYNCWVFGKLMIGDHMLHEPFCNQKKKRIVDS